MRDHVAVAFQAHVARRRQFLLGKGVVKIVGKDGLATPPQAHLALGLEFPVLVPLHAVGVEEHGLGVAFSLLVGNQGGLELELEAGVFGFRGQCGQADQQDDCRGKAVTMHAGC